MSSRSKRQTMAKMTRERTVKERRALKQEKKHAAAAARNAAKNPQFGVVENVDRSGWEG